MKEGPFTGLPMHFVAVMQWCERGYAKIVMGYEISPMVHGYY
ncbi:unnamed protein product [marine sediment metagenome]|uniref:Uncharacterized protein n=1 Tax=marine sediment metagenome TaxID=412755 RepID=X0U498_9ZZZZ